MGAIVTGVSIHGIASLSFIPSLSRPGAVRSPGPPGTRCSSGLLSTRSPLCPVTVLPA